MFCFSSVLVEYYKRIPIEQRKIVKYNTCLDSVVAISPPVTVVRKSTPVKTLDPISIEKHYRKQVEILKIESPSNFYVTCPEWIPIRHRLTKEMKLFYSANKVVNAEWNIDDKCAALSPKQNAWYRAIILEINNTTCTVFLKDIAMKEVVPLENIQPLEKRFLQERNLAICCSLHGIIPAGGSNKWPQIAIETFQQIRGKYSEYYMTKQGNVNNKTIPVNLYVMWEEDCGPLEPSKSINVLINKLLVEKGVALPVKVTNNECELFDFDQDPFCSLPEPSVDEQIERVPKSWLPPMPLKEKRFKAKATYVDVNGYVYLHPIMYENNLEQIKRVLNNNFLKTQPDELHTWYPGQMCTVQYHLDHAYYRGVVLEELSDNLIKVQLIDYGNEEECKHTELRSEIILLEEPIMATRCKLFNVLPQTEDEKWPISLLDKLHATIVDQEIDVEIMNQYSSISDEPYEIIVMFQNVNINIQLMSMDWNQAAQEEVKGNIIDEDIDVIIEGCINENNDTIQDWVSLANFEQQNEAKYKYVNIPNNCTSFEAIVISILNLNTVALETSFNVDTLKNTEGEFEKLMQEMDELAIHQPVIFEPVVGQSCCAEWDEDKKWYRAEVFSLDSIDSGTVEVLFVDFGNIEPVSRENIRMLRKEWVEYPVQQIKCIIDGLRKSDEVDTEDASKYLSSALLDKKVKVVVREIKPMLKAVLYESNGIDLIYRNGIESGIFVES